MEVLTGGNSGKLISWNLGNGEVVKEYDFAITHKLIHISKEKIIASSFKRIPNSHPKKGLYSLSVLSIDENGIHPLVEYKDCFKSSILGITHLRKYPDLMIAAGNAHGGTVYSIEILNVLREKKESMLDENLGVVREILNKGEDIVTCSHDGSISVYDVRHKKLLRKNYSAHSDYCSCISLSRNGELIASGGFDHRVKFWDYNFRFLGFFQTKSERIQAIKFSNYHEHPYIVIAGGDRGSLFFIDIRRSFPVKVIHKAHEHWIREIRMIDHERFCTVSGDGYLKVWNFEENECLFGMKKIFSDSFVKNSLSTCSCFNKAVELMEIQRNDLMERISYLKQEQRRIEKNECFVMIVSGHRIVVFTRLLLLL